MRFLPFFLFAAIGAACSGEGTTTLTIVEAAPHPTQTGTLSVAGAERRKTAVGGNSSEHGCLDGLGRHWSRDPRYDVVMALTIPVRRGTKVAVLTGAGISAESGVPTFRDANGLWEQHRIEDVATPEGWRADPKLVWRFYSERRKKALEVAPNPAHFALARLEQHLGDDFFLATQNVDGLHEAAGSQRVVHMHGELMKSRCENDACDQLPRVDQALHLTAIPTCSCGARIRPHIVWFGEMPFEMHTIKRRVQACDWFITIGSSGAVYPAAGLVREIQYRQSQREEVRSVYVGLEAPENADAFDEVVLGKAGEVLPTLFELVA